jgi:hypothetical protein
MCQPSKLRPDRAHTGIFVIELDRMIRSDTEMRDEYVQRQTRVLA